MICASLLLIQPQKAKILSFLFFPPHLTGLEDVLKQTKKYQQETNTAATLRVYF